jgi:hypothetical protein
MFIHFSFFSPSDVRTCNEMKRLRGLNYNTWVQIDPDGKNTGVDPFFVWCDMKTEGGVGVIVIGKM